MPKYEMRHMEDDEANQEPAEIVGSKDLRESFKDKTRLQGSFSINGAEFTNFEANSPANAVQQINARTGQTGVTASIDDQGHLVLESNNPDQPVITQGAAYVAPPQTYASPEAERAALTAASEARMAREAKGEKDPASQNTILEDLGLEATEQDAEGAAVRPGFETGSSAEDRKKAREEAAKNGGAAAGRTAGAGQTLNPTQIPSAPVTGGQVDGKLDDGRGRVGTGAGLQSYPDGTRPVRNSEAEGGLQGGNPLDNANAGQQGSQQP